MKEISREKQNAGIHRAKVSTRDLGSISVGVALEMAALERKTLTAVVEENNAAEPQDPKPVRVRAGRPLSFRSSAQVPEKVCIDSSQKSVNSF